MRRTKIIIPSLIVAGIVTWLVINRIKKNKLYKQILSDLETGAKSGDPQQEIGILTKSGGALDPNYYNTVPASGKKVLSQASLSEVIKKMHGWIHGLLGSDEEAIIKFFSKLRAKTEVSQIAEAYQKSYKVSLGDDLKTIDYVVGGQYLPGFLTPSFDLPKVIAAINSLPDK